MLKALLLFLLIALLGANAAIYLAHRGSPQAQAHAAGPPAQVAMPERPQADAVSPPEPAKQPAAKAQTPPPSLPPTAPAPANGAMAAAVPDAALPSGLVIPVRGIAASQLGDTFSDARAQGRVHEAIDIMAPRGTPVLAVADGTVEKLFNSVPGGLTIYQFEPSGRYAYYYAHLDRYADGLAEKQAIRQGQVIGYVGSTGNADPSAPHLHFAVFVLGPERQWWKGTAINPYPLLRAR